MSVGSVLAPTEGAPSTSGNVHVSIINAVGVRVYGRVQGKLVPDLSRHHPVDLSAVDLATQFGGAASLNRQGHGIQHRECSFGIDGHRFGVATLRGSAGAKVVKVPRTAASERRHVQCAIQECHPVRPTLGHGTYRLPRGRHDRNGRHARHSMAPPAADRAAGGGTSLWWRHRRKLAARPPRPACRRVSEPAVPERRCRWHRHRPLPGASFFGGVGAGAPRASCRRGPRFRSCCSVDRPDVVVVGSGRQFPGGAAPAPTMSLSTTNLVPGQDHDGRSGAGRPRTRCFQAVLVRFECNRREYRLRGGRRVQYLRHRRTDGSLHGALQVTLPPVPCPCVVPVAGTSNDYTRRPAL